MTLTCDDAREILDGAFDGRDEGARLSEAEIHADRCEACGAYRRELRAYAALMGDLPEVQVPAGLESRLLGAVERTRPKRRSPFLLFALLALVGFGGTLGAGFVQAYGQDRAREARDAQEHRESIARRVERDRALHAADPLGGTPLVAFTGYARE